MDERSRELKKHWKAAEKNFARARFPLEDPQLEAMFDAVEAALVDTDCDHSLRATMQWLTTNAAAVDAVVEWLQNNGGYCDCEVLYNAREHWENNR